MMLDWRWERMGSRGPELHQGYHGRKERVWAMRNAKSGPMNEVTVAVEG